MQLIAEVTARGGVVRIDLYPQTRGNEFFRVRSAMFRLAAELEEGRGRTGLPARDAITVLPDRETLMIEVSRYQDLDAWASFVTSVLRGEGIALRK